MFFFSRPTTTITGAPPKKSQGSTKERLYRDLLTSTLNGPKTHLNRQFLSSDHESDRPNLGPKLGVQGLL